MKNADFIKDKFRILMCVTYKNIWLISAVSLKRRDQMPSHNMSACYFLNTWYIHHGNPVLTPLIPCRVIHFDITCSDPALNIFNLVGTDLCPVQHEINVHAIHQIEKLSYCKDRGIFCRFARNRVNSQNFEARKARPLYL